MRDRFFVAGDPLDEAKIASWLAAHDDFARDLLRVFTEVAPDRRMVRPVLIVLRDRSVRASERSQPRRESFYIDILMIDGVDHSRIEERLAALPQLDHWNWGPRRVRSLPGPEENA